LIWEPVVAADARAAVAADNITSKKNQGQHRNDVAFFYMEGQWQSQIIR